MSPLVPSPRPPCRVDVCLPGCPDRRLPLPLHRVLDEHTLRLTSEGVRVFRYTFRLLLDVADHLSPVERRRLSAQQQEAYLVHPATGIVLLLDHQAAASRFAVECILRDHHENNSEEPALLLSPGWPLVEFDRDGYPTFLAVEDRPPEAATTKTAIGPGQACSQEPPRSTTRTTKPAAQVPVGGPAPPRSTTRTTAQVPVGGQASSSYPTHDDDGGPQSFADDDTSMVPLADYEACAARRRQAPAKKKEKRKQNRRYISNTAPYDELRMDQRPQKQQHTHRPAVETADSTDPSIVWEDSEEDDASTVPLANNSRRYNDAPRRRTVPAAKWHRPGALGHDYVLRKFQQPEWQNQPQHLVPSAPQQQEQYYNRTPQKTDRAVQTTSPRQEEDDSRLARSNHALQSSRVHAAVQTVGPQTREIAVQIPSPEDMVARSNHVAVQTVGLQTREIAVQIPSPQDIILAQLNYHDAAVQTMGFENDDRPLHGLSFVSSVHTAETSFEYPPEERREIASMPPTSTNQPPAVIDAEALYQQRSHGGEVTPQVIDVEELQRRRILGYNDDDRMQKDLGFAASKQAILEPTEEYGQTSNRENQSSIVIPEESMPSAVPFAAKQFTATASPRTTDNKSPFKKEEAGSPQHSSRNRAAGRANHYVKQTEPQANKPEKPKETKAEKSDNILFKDPSQGMTIVRKTVPPSIKEPKEQMVKKKPDNILFNDPSQGMTIVRKTVPPSIKEPKEQMVKKKPDNILFNDPSQGMTIVRKTVPPSIKEPKEQVAKKKPDNILFNDPSQGMTIVRKTVPPIADPTTKATTPIVETVEEDTPAAGPTTTELSSVSLKPIPRAKEAPVAPSVPPEKAPEVEDEEPQRRKTEVDGSKLQSVFEAFKGEEDETTIGCYLFYDGDGCKLIQHYSKTPVEGALAFYSGGPHKKIPGFKFKSNQGRSDLIKNCNPSGSTGVGRKNYFSGWCQFVRAARAYKGTLEVFAGVGPLEVDLYTYETSEKKQTEKIPPNTKWQVKDFDAVACVPKDTKFFEGISMDLVRWIEQGGKLGATIKN